MQVIVRLRPKVRVDQSMGRSERAGIVSNPRLGRWLSGQSHAYLMHLLYVAGSRAL